MSRHRGGTCELGIAMHTAHGVGHAVRSRACCHVVRMEGTASAAAGSNGEVLLAILDAVLLVAASHRMLEAGGVGGVAGDGDVNVLQLHDGNAFLYGLSAVAANLGTEAIAVSHFLHDVNLVSLEVILGLHEGEAVDAADDLGSILAQAVQDDAQGVLANQSEHNRINISTRTCLQHFTTFNQLKIA